MLYIVYHPFFVLSTLFLKKYKISCLQIFIDILLYSCYNIMIRFLRNGGAVLPDEHSKKKELDDFWNIEALVPTKKTLRPISKSTETVIIKDGVLGTDGREASSDTLIKRFIPPHSSNELLVSRTGGEQYVPENSLLHKVTLYKESSTYSFYEEFSRQIRKLWDCKGVPTEYVDFFSYSPQYDQLTKAQLRYYLWWRENLRNGIFLETNLCYINLLTFELINCGNLISHEAARDIMIRVITNYADTVRGATSRYIRWIADYSLIHRLPPPEDFPDKLLKQAGTLKEYFINIPGNTADGWARALLRYCCSYDYRTSRFATKENISLYDIHVHGAITEIVKKLSENGKILSGVPFGDCKVIAKAFDGAICNSDNRYTVEIEYCSFSRSHELRFLIGDAVKYAENKIRAHISVKSRLTVYSLPLELQAVIDGYFAMALPISRKKPQLKEKPQEYDALYDLPAKKLDLSNAARIELESWDTTNELISAFSEGEGAVSVSPISLEKVTLTVPDAEKVSSDDVSLAAALSEYLSELRALKSCNTAPLRGLCTRLGKPIEAVVDEINEVAVDIIGDILIEETENGYGIIEDYADQIV